MKTLIFLLLIAAPCMADDYNDYNTNGQQQVYDSYGYTTPRAVIAPRSVLQQMEYDLVYGNRQQSKRIREQGREERKNDLNRIVVEDLFDYLDKP